MKKLIAVAVVAALAAVFAQGPLPPPAGAPAPTMKTLQQVEPRIDLQAPTLPPSVSTDADYHFIINKPGSYYLSSTLEVTKTNGVDVRAAGVTIDLNGFEIRRASGAGGNGIEIDATSHRCVVKDGSIIGFATGVFTASGAKGGEFARLAASNCTSSGLITGQSWRVESSSAFGNGSRGIVANEGSVVRGCTADGNGVYGIEAQSAAVIDCAVTGNGAGIIGRTVVNCVAAGNNGDGINGDSVANCSAINNVGSFGISGRTLENCVSHANTASYGIFVTAGGTASHCRASSNTSSGALSYGIYGPSPVTIIGCTAVGNTSTATATHSTGIGIFAGGGSTVNNCTVVDNRGDGIRTDNGSTISGCTVGGNGYDGIEALNSCLIIGNHCSFNGENTTDGAGIHITGQEGRVDSNNVANNDRGIRVDDVRNFVIRNTARDNLLMNYVIVAGNRVGVIVIPALSGDIAGDSDADALGVGTTDPWANFTY